MKKYTITNSEHQEFLGHSNDRLYDINSEGGEDMQVSDGYHTMDELYDHRIALWIVVCSSINYRNAVFKSQGTIMNGDHGVWRSKKHSDGEPAFGGTWFVLGIGKEPGNQITYHLPINMWESTDFVETLDKAPEWDGHSSADVLERLKKL